MPKPITHKRREIILPSFPNNRLSSRQGKKRVEKREWIEEDSQIYSRLPDTAISTPYDLPNPTDSAPSFFNTQTMNYSEIGGYAPIGFSDEFSPNLVGTVPGMIPGLGNSNFDPSPVALMLDVGHGFSWVAVPDQGYTETGGVQEFFLVSGLDYPSMYTGGYNVNVTIYDMAGNVAYMETEVDGLFSGVMDFLTMIWDGLCGVMEAAADAVGAAMSFLWDMLIAFYMAIFSPVLEALNTTIGNFLNGLEVLSEDLFVPHSDPEYVIDPEGAIDKYMDYLILNKFMSTFMAIGLVIYGIELIANVALPGLGIVIAAFAGSLYFAALMNMIYYGSMKVQTESGFQPAFTLADSEISKSLSILDSAGKLAIKIALVAITSLSVSLNYISYAIGSMFFSTMSLITSVIAEKLGSDSITKAVLFALSVAFLTISSISLGASLVKDLWIAPGTVLMAFLFWMGSFVNTAFKLASLYYGI